jgi:hypothetical protein
MHKTNNKSTAHKWVPWWSSDLRVLRERTNALRRLYQRTRNNEELRDKRKTQYYEGRATYTAAIKQAKINHGKNTATWRVTTIPGMPLTN